MKMNGGTRSGLLALAGGYVLYLAWEMFADLRDGKTEMAPRLAMVFITFFALAGIAVIVYAARVWFKSRKDGENDEPDGDDNPNSLK